MKTFEPILKDQPLSYAYNRPNYFRNKARESKFGVPVYFVPSTNKYDVVGCGGPYYVYGKPSMKGNGGYNGNCTWWVIGRLHEITGTCHSELVGDGVGFYDKYKGRKDNVGYIGDTIQKGDVLVYADSDVGHVHIVEDVVGDTLYISESAYSKNKVYEDKACIVYTLDKKNMTCGKNVTLRPQAPYTEKLKGVLHTGDVFDKEDNLEKINKLAKQIVDLSK